MPTKRRRTAIVHTAQVMDMLNVARLRWPEAPRDSVLIRHLLQEGVNALEATEQRRACLRDLSRHSGFYPDGYLDELRGGWE